MDAFDVFREAEKQLYEPHANNRALLESCADCGCSILWRCGTSWRCWSCVPYGREQADAVHWLPADGLYPAWLDDPKHWRDGSGMPDNPTPSSRTFSGADLVLSRPPSPQTTPAAPHQRHRTRR